MLVPILRLLGRDELRSILAIVADEKFEAGATTAIGSAARVKNNLQLPISSGAAQRAARVVVQALRQNAGFQTATWSAAMTLPLICRYETGMSYGDHIDSPLMGEGLARIRCDLAVTVLLADKADYDGGELVIEVDGANHRWKADAGDCVIYPADTLHRVEPITRGVRLAAVFWIQTLVRDGAKRKILFEMAQAIRDLEQSIPAAPAVDTLRRSYSNLIRMWVEPRVPDGHA